MEKKMFVYSYQMDGMKRFEFYSDKASKLFGAEYLGTTTLQIEEEKKEVVKTLKAISATIEGASYAVPISSIPPNAYDVEVSYKIKE